MGCETSWLSSAHLPLAALALRRPYRRWRLPVCSAGETPYAPVPKDRRWYNPERRRRLYNLKPVRRWIEAEDLSLSDSTDSRNDRFVLVSYNILADKNASHHRDLYWKIPFDVMKWDSRKGLIFQEICRWNADIVCLQAIDRYEDILMNMKKKGYAGSYKGRTGLAKDGCAIFWKVKRFRLLEEDYIEFSAFGLRDNVAQLFVFEKREADPRRLVVGNIHVLFNPKRGDIKLGQVRLLLSKVNALSEKWDNIPVVLAGDFNSTPESAIYEFLSTSELDIAAHDRRYIFGQDRCEFALYDLPSFLKFHWTDEELKNATGQSKCTKLEHPLKLHSAYASVKGNARTRGRHGEPLATTYHSKFLGTVDYIWYSTGLACTRVLDTISIDILRKLGGLPSKEMGSDHIALLSEFIFKECRDLELQGPANSSTEEDTTH
ncbi:carbon catabolite repressor protein 4 homolog 3 isoform X1 [Elaeis guineensis]|uniref:carbon catabolite repressor protein 4 homolog 3 isoform X1 n=2 Tax=Elaeis guineensis var. tenera TaxID=51953 RepID=UPI003C6D9D7D